MGWRTGSAQLDQPNFIFIVVDDLNDYVQGITDQPQVLTPNIQELANRGMLFSNAYANSPGCA
ncbi:MAG TPA: sulfatase-like hydrolase/transferase, partial [Chitinophagales bacterium]|nr:sulfatase-like hydrolase/transferase [Chitinophagales bacterium]HNE45643.1 sulfatase-like hydrolase/transferase [Chitinophagales bacterium]HNM28311.1 sulfatase-like hydrolase/transferase [Chitinophagales bacterium]HNO27422.1 sulfatase-like hydrolase/transferase [Chitinophagales bacterium]